MAKREDPWSWSWPWQLDDAEPPLPVRGVPGGWRDPWSADTDVSALRAEAEAAERERRAALAMERERSAP